MNEWMNDVKFKKKVKEARKFGQLKGDEEGIMEKVKRIEGSRKRE